MIGPVFKRERHARRPHASHADSEQRADSEQHRVARRKATENAEQRQPQDGENQRRLAAESVRGSSRAQSTHQAKQKRDCSERAGEGLIYGEGVFNVDQQKTQDGEIESIRGPAKKCSEERVPLDPGNVSKSGTPAYNTRVRTGLDRSFDFALWHLCEYTPDANDAGRCLCSQAEARVKRVRAGYFATRSQTKVLSMTGRLSSEASTRN